MNIGRVTVALAAMSALGLTAACGPSDSAAGTSPVGSSPVGTSPAAGSSAVAPPAGASMESGCDTVSQLFAALAGGDKATAESLKARSAGIFNDVAATEAAGNVQLATDAAAMASILEFELPREQIYQSSLAETYTVDCVGRHSAAALPTS